MKSLKSESATGALVRCDNPSIISGYYCHAWQAMSVMGRGEEPNDSRGRKGRQDGEESLQTEQVH